MENRLFLPQAALDQWVTDGTADWRDGKLTLGGGGTLRLTEAIHVLRDAVGGGAGADLVGRVKLRSELEELGAEIVETSMLIGDAAYDVEPGWLAVPLGKLEGRDAELLARLASRD